MVSTFNKKIVFGPAPDGQPAQITLRMGDGLQQRHHRPPAAPEGSLRIPQFGALQGVTKRSS